MPHGGMEPDSVTYAIMVRMALRMLHPSKRDRTIRRYWTFAEKAGIQDEIGLVGVLNEQEALQLREVSLDPPFFCSGARADGSGCF